MEQYFFNLFDNNQGIQRSLAPGLHSRIFCGKNIMISIVTIDAHSSGTVHHHPEEQWGVLLEGECIRFQDGKEISIKKGDFWYTPGGVSHSIKTGNAPAIVMDIFSPPRGEYKEAGSGYGKTGE